MELFKENENFKDVYIAQDSNHINEWGMLQFFETIKETTNGKLKADTLLSLYNRKTRSLSVSSAFGNIYVRGGNLVPVNLNLGDIKVMNYMLVENVKHTFYENEHVMDIQFIGGDFVA